MARGKTVDVAAILGGQLAKVSESDTDMRWIETERILDNPLNFYPKPTNTQLAELMESIQANGLLEPPTVVPDGRSDRLLSGHSRMEAARPESRGTRLSESPMSSDAANGQVS